MGKGVSISVASDTKDFLKGIKTGVIEPLEDASDQLRDLAKDGEKAGDKLEDSMRDAQRDTEKLAKEYDDLGDKIRESSRKGGQGLKDHTSDATHAAARDLGELKDEAVQNASETFSSFDGSVDSLVDGVQGTFGGIVSSLGPLGAAMGAAAAVGIGLLTAELQKSAEEAEKVREETSELALEIIDAGGKLEAVPLVDKVREWSMEIADNKEWWEVWQAASVTNLDKVREASKLTGVDMKDMFAAMSGLDTSGSLDMLEDLEGRLSEVRGEYNKLARSRAGGTARAGELKAELDGLESTTKAIRDKLGVQEGGIDQAREVLSLTEDYAAAEEAATAATEARADAMSALQSELDASVSAFGDFVDAESGVFDPAAYIAGMEEKRHATENFNANVQDMTSKFRLSADEQQAILDLGLDFAPYLQSIIDSGMAPEFIAQIQAAVGGGQDIIDGTPMTATVTAESDTASAREDLNQTAGEKRTAGIGATADTRRAERDLNATASKRRVANITARAHTATATGMLERTARQRVAMVRAVADTWGAEAAMGRLTRPRVVQVTADVRTRDGKAV